MSEETGTGDLSMNLRVRCFILIGLLATVLLLGGSDDSHKNALTTQQKIQLLLEAQDAYDQGIKQRRDTDAADRQFRISAERFNQLIDVGLNNGMIHYNLANAYLQLGDLGLAIYHYRLAELYFPGNSRLQRNLAYARSLRQDHFSTSSNQALTQTILAWHYRIPFLKRAYIFLCVYLLFWVLLVLYRVRRSILKRNLIIACGVLALLVGLSLSWNILFPPPIEGVLLDDQMTVRKGGGEGFAPQFEQPLHEGVEFFVLEEHSQWLRIALPNEQTGWIPARSVVLLH